MRSKLEQNLLITQALIALALIKAGKVTKKVVRILIVRPLLKLIRIFRRLKASQRGSIIIGILIVLLLLFSSSCTLVDKAKSKVGLDKTEETKEEQKESNEKVLINISAINKYEEDLRKLRAELESKTLEQNILLKTEFYKGYEEGKKDSSTGLSDEVSRAMADASKAIEETAQSLAKFSYPSAVVNGTCVGRMAQGGLYKYTVVNACVGVVYKKVNARAEIVGIEAVSLEAQKDGIVSLTCDAGDAHFTMLPQKCSEARSSGGGVQRTDIGR